MARAKRTSPTRSKRTPAKQAARGTKGARTSTAARKATAVGNAKRAGTSKGAASGSASTRKGGVRRGGAAVDRALKELRAFGLRYPEAATRSPWPGHLDLVVRDKTFAFLSVEGEPFGISCKLPHSHPMALQFPWAHPTPYGLGRSGWVSARPPADEPVPVELLKAWIDESYRAQAPKRLVKLLPPSASGPA